MALQYKVNSTLTKSKPIARPNDISLSKRILLRSIRRQSPILIESAMALKGYIMTVENGYIVKLKADGSRESISKLKAVKRPSKIVLD